MLCVLKDSDKNKEMAFTPEALSTISCTVQSSWASGSATEDAEGAQVGAGDQGGVLLPPCAANPPTLPLDPSSLSLPAIQPTLSTTAYICSAQFSIYLTRVHSMNLVPINTERRGSWESMSLKVYILSGLFANS